MEKHTPAPWRFLPRVGYLMGSDGKGPFGAMEVQVGTVGNYHDDEILPFNRERWDADGHLIAAAPEMLAALKDAESCFDAMAEEGYLNDHRRAVWAAMRAAIAKARG